MLPSKACGTSFSGNPGLKGLDPAKNMRGDAKKGFFGQNLRIIWLLLQGIMV